MKKIYTFLIAFALLLFNQLSAQVIDAAFYSQALGQSKYVDVFLPPGYNDNPGLSYPVIYYLHGWGGSQNSAETIMAEADTLINSGQIEPVIIVCADNGNTPFLGSFFVNSSLNGDFEDYNVIDLVDWVENTYRAIPDRNHRALMGQSMGGYGAFRYGIVHKDKFRLIAAHGSAINFDLALNDFAVEVINENQPGPPYFYDFNNTGLFTQMIFAMSGAFSPNQNTPQNYINPQNVEFPLDDQGLLIDSVYAKWKVFDPVNYIDSLSPGDSVAILFGAGTNDNLYLYPPNIAFKDTLDQLGLEYEFYEHTGTHGMPRGFKIRALEFIDSVMSVVPSTSSCIAPSNQTETSFSSSSVLLNWTENGNAATWEILLGLSGFDTAGILPVSVNTWPYTWNNLLPSTSYEWYIRSDCGNGDFSEWVGPSDFTTPVGSTLLPASLPFIEGWENSSGTTKTDGDFITASSYKWSFETDRQDEGRLRWGSDAYLVHNGIGAMTLDKHPNTGTYAINGAILTINLSTYSGSGDLELSFWWTDHHDEDQTDDKVWIRGSSNDEWLEVYDLDPVTNTDDVYQFVGGLDIDQTLSSASPQQNITESFQVRFGQKDNSFAPGDGLSFDEISITSQQVASCIEPSGLVISNITQTTADVSWIENGDATTWEILLGAAGFDTTAQTPISVSTNPHTLSGLLSATAYDVYVRSVCDIGLHSSYGGPVTFTTQVSGSGGLSPATLPFSEGWEANNGVIQSAGEMYATSTYEWSFKTDKPNEGRGRWGDEAYLTQTGNGALTMDKFPNNGTYAINSTLLTINMSNYSGSAELELSFWWADHNDEDQANDKVWVRGSDVDEWIEIYDLDPAQQQDGTYHQVSGLDIDQAINSAIPQQSFSSTFQVRFGQHDNSFTPGDGLSFDNILIEDVQQQETCTDPSGQLADNITETSADLSWTENGNADSWEIMLGLSGFDTAGFTFTPVQSNPYSWTGLSASTNYDWYVRAVCDGGTKSNWVGPDVFATDSPPPPPSGILPFTEDWETNSGTRQTNGDIYTETDYSWYFSTDQQSEGRARWGSSAHMARSGSGAITLDRTPMGAVTNNHAVLQIDLSPYVASPDLFLSFWWVDHKDEEHEGDKVWIRGNDTEQWVEIYDLNPKQSKNNTFQLVSGLDIDATLDGASQVVSSTTQISLGQADNFPTSWDGITFDDITIEEDAGYQPSVFPEMTSHKESGIEEETMLIYTNEREIIIKSFGEFVFQPKEVEVYDMYGRLLTKTSLQASYLSRINVKKQSGYLIIKVNSAETITVSKVFVN